MVTDSVWLGPSLWAALYLSDNLLTIACARLYRGQDKIAFEGSYEITPMFQADVNALRRISPRFLLILIASTGYVSLVQHVAKQSLVMQSTYSFVLGLMLLVEATVHLRHLRNWFLFRHGLGPNGAQGRIEYPRGIMLRASSFELFAFSVVYAGIFLLTEAPFLLGGAVGCLALSINHYILARRHARAQARAV